MMSESQSSPNEIVRRALLRIDSATVLAGVDALDLRPNNRISAVVGIPLRNLQQRRDVAAFAISAPIAAVRALLEVLATEPLEKLITLLGDHADSPSVEQLSFGIDQLREDGMSPEDIVAVLTFAIGEEFPAAAHCRTLLESRPEFHLPVMPVVSGTRAFAGVREKDPDVQAKRQARRSQAKKKHN